MDSNPPTTQQGKTKIYFEKLLPGIQKNISLKDYTTFKIGGNAKYFFVAKNKEDLIEAIKAAKKIKLPFFILGGGSNTLVSDRGFKGLVINFQFSNFKFQKNKIIAGAGTPLAILVSEAAKKNLTGLEWAAGIPGTIGGAIYGNAGAFGESISDVVKEVKVYDVKNEKVKILKDKDCKFGYRDSIFKKDKNLIILSATLQLKEGDSHEIKKRMEEYLNYRKENQPLNFPSAGSIFKNPPGFLAGKLGEEDKSSSSSLAAARLIEKCGLKGKKIGKAQVSKKHANFILNLGGASAKDVKKLIELIKQKVKQKFGVELEEEITILS